MKVENQTVWTTDAGEELLRRKAQDRWFVPLGGIDSETLRDLRDACIDACKVIEPPAEQKGEK